MKRMCVLQQHHIPCLQSENHSKGKSLRAKRRLAQERVQTNLKCQENVMMMIKLHERKGNPVAEEEAYEQLVELQEEMKSLKSREKELQADDPATMKKSMKRKKLRDDLLDQQRDYLAASSNNNVPKKTATDDDTSNPTAPSKDNDEEDSNDNCFPDYGREMNLQRNDIPPMVGNNRSNAVQIDNDSTLNSDS